MSHWHDEHHDDHDAHGAHGDHWHDDHGHGGHGEEHEEEPLLVPAGLINDLSPTHGEDPTVDLTEFFPISSVLAVKHNDSHQFNDLKSWAGKEFDFSVRPVIKISKYKTKRTSDILARKDCQPSIVAFVDKKRPVRPETLDVMPPLAVPENAFDVRALEIVPVAVTRPDIYGFPLPFPKRVFRYVRRHRRIVLKTWFSTAVAAMALISWTMGAVSYAQTGVEKAYGELFALKDAAKSGPEAFAASAERATWRFDKLRIAFSPITAAFDSPVVSVESVRIAWHVVRWGAHLAEAAKIASGIWSDFEKETRKYGDFTAAFWSGSDFKATDFADAHFEAMKEIDAEISLALMEYSKVESLGNPELDEKFKYAVTLLVATQNRLRFALDRKDAILAAVWHEAPQRYLVLNQNRDEIRATWGFPGSAVFLEFYKWRLSKYEKKDIYYYDWHLFPYAEKAPPGLDRIAEKWGLRDANYYPEMSRNFAVIDAFYQKSWGSSLNGIAVMNQGIVTDLLRKYGPVRMEKIKKTVDADNFSTLMSVLVENKIAKTYSPKDVLFDFVAELEKTLLDKKDFAGYLEILDKNAKTGELLAYSNDPKVNALFEEAFPGEKSRSFSGNFVYPVFTSISGNKSDRYVRRTFEIKSQPTEWCKVLNSFRLESDHRMSVDDKERVRWLLYDLGIPPEDHERQIFIQGNGDNKQYVRVLLPKGSKLSWKPPIQIEIDETMPDYDVFSFYMNTVPGDKSAAFFDYESDIRDCSKKPVFYAQPGLQHYSVKND